MADLRPTDSQLNFAALHEVVDPRSRAVSSAPQRFGQNTILVGLQLNLDSLFQVGRRAELLWRRRNCWQIRDRRWTPIGATEFPGQAARQQSGAADVRFGSEADIEVRLRNVCFTRKSRRRAERLGCLLCAKSRHCGGPFGGARESGRGQSLSSRTAS